MPKIKYTVKHDNGTWEMEVEIDHQVADKYMKETVHFWSGAEWRLYSNDGDYTKAFLKMLGRECYAHMAVCNLGLAGLLSHFKNEEGWPLFDGSHGIWITAVDNSDLDDTDFEVEKA